MAQRLDMLVAIYCMYYVVLEYGIWLTHIKFWNNTAAVTHRYRKSLCSAALSPRVAPRTNRTMIIHFYSWRVCADQFRFVQSRRVRRCVSRGACYLTWTNSFILRHFIYVCAPQENSRCLHKLLYNMVESGLYLVRYN